MHYTNRECIEVVGLPDSTTDNEVCSVFKKIGVDVSVDNIEACHPLKSDNKNKIIVKFSKRKDCQAVIENKKKLKNLSNEELGLATNSKVFVNESLCKYYKLLWSQCKSLWNDICVLDDKWFPKIKIQTRWSCSYNFSP